jgi:hypothetical protein
MLALKFSPKWLNMMADHVVHPSQTSFMQGRNILDGVAILHEIVHELHSKTLNEFIKIVFEKAYDKVKWSFLQQTLKMKGFFMSGVLLYTALCLEVVWQLRSMRTQSITSGQKKAKRR